MALVPTGHHGILLKSWIPSNTLYADSFGYTLEVRNIFNESCACGINLFQIAAGQFSSIVPNPEIQWFLKVWMALSAAFTIWLWGSTNCILMSSDSRYVWIYLLATLSMMLKSWCWSILLP